MRRKSQKANKPGAEKARRRNGKGAKKPDTLPTDTGSLYLAVDSTRTAVGLFQSLVRRSGTHCQINSKIWVIRRVILTVSTRVFNSGRLGVNTPKNFSPYAQILGRGRHDVQINSFLLRLFVYNKLDIDVRICFPMFR